MRRLLLLALVACLGCGSSEGTKPSGSGTVNGTVGGRGLTVRAVVFAIDSTNLVALALADRDDICTVLGSSSVPSGATTALIFGLVNAGTGSVPVAVGTGTYNWLGDVTSVPPPGLYWQGDFGQGTGCTLASATAATAGTITITQVGNTTGTHLQGTFNASFGAEALTGSFDAVHCPALVNPGAACDDLRSRPAVLR